MKFLQFALVAFTALSIISCSNDDDNTSELPNSVTIDGITQSITNERALINKSNINIRFDTYKGDDKAKERERYSEYSFSIPVENIGKKMPFKLDNRNDGNFSVGIWKTLNINGKYEKEYILIVESSYTEHLQGKNNWVQFTEVDKSKSIYKIEFELSARNMVIKGNHTTEFEVNN